MGWFSNAISNAFSTFGRAASDASAAAAPAADADTVQEARIRSRRRLIGAVVLVVIGVIGFPLVFETQPRPIPVDIPIEIPRKEGVPPLAMPSAKVAAPVASAPATAPSAPAVATRSAPAKPVAAQAVEEVIAPGRPPAAVSSLPVLTPAPPVKAAEKSASAPVKTAAKPVVPAESDKAKALLEGSSSAKADSPKEAGRFVVQVGAFAENDAARNTRLKVEKLGLKTYVQVAETPAGKRIRVRVGPYVSKEEAEQAKTKLTAGGFPAVLLTL
jgi:DedD protein